MNIEILQLEKQCKSCLAIKVLTEFPTRLSYDKISRTPIAVCRDCNRARARRYGQQPKTKLKVKERISNNRDKVNQARKAWREKNREREKANRRRLKYGITQQEFNNLLHNQNGLCAICNEQMPFEKAICVDHDHTTGKVRGLLCYFCNLALGITKDRPRILRKAAEYLELNGTYNE